MYQQPPGGYQPQPGYGPPPGQPGYAPPGGQPGYGPPGGQPGYPGAPPPAGYGAPQGYPGAPGAPPQARGGPPPGMDPNLYSWFVAVDQDQSGKITADELRQALVNGNWTQFNAETCRLMIGMFDRDQSGTIDVNEFAALWQYIQQWKGTFERYDRDRSGAIEGHELHQAFNEMGYRVSPQFVGTIVSKYDRVARRSLKLGDFIQACVTMKTLTDAFKQRDTNLSGSITISYEDFMSLVLLNKP